MRTLEFSWELREAHIRMWIWRSTNKNLKGNEELGEENRSKFWEKKKDNMFWRWRIEEHIITLKRLSKFSLKIEDRVWHWGIEEHIRIFLGVEREWIIFSLVKNTDHIFFSGKNTDQHFPLRNTYQNFLEKEDSKQVYLVLFTFW